MLNKINEKVQHFSTTKIKPKRLYRTTGTDRQQLFIIPVAFAVAKTVDSSVAVEVGRLVDEGEIVSLIAMLVVALSTEMVLLSTQTAKSSFFLKSVVVSIKTRYHVRQFAPKNLVK